MRKSKVLASAVAVALVASVAAASAISASAISGVADIKDHKVGIVGSFNDWSTEGEVFMNDDDGDGVWEGVIDIENVTAAMLVEQETDLGPDKGKVKTGKVGVNFKVRLDQDWDDSWGLYEPAFSRTNNSQTNCLVEAEEGTHIKITVKLDTTKNDPEAVAAGDVDASDPVDYLLIPVTATVEKVEAPAESSAESSTEESSAATTTSTTSTTTTTGTTSTQAASTPAGTSSSTESSPATGDTTSAVALVAVVLASLGTAVVMTKKASSKD